MVTVQKSNNYFIQAAIVMIASLIFMPFLGSVHLFDWDEINFAEAAREMIVSKNYLTVQINYQPFWEKPPLFIWMQVISMKCFGINEFAARFPNSICGILTFLVLFNIGRKLFDSVFGILWTIVYCCSVLPFFYFKSGIIDPWFNLFVFLGIYFLILYLISYREDKPSSGHIAISAVFIGLGILTKGPVALLIYFLTYFVILIFEKFRISLRFKDILLFLIIVSLVGGAWFLVQILSGHFNVVKSFILYQIRLLSTKDAGHGGFFGYHFVVLIFGVFPASFFAINSFSPDLGGTSNQKYFKKWMAVLFWVVLILFSLVKTKIIHYSSLCYFPLTFLGTIFIYKVKKNESKYRGIYFFFIALVMVLFSLLIFALQEFVKYKYLIIESGVIKDEFALGNLKAEVHWSGNEFIIGLIMLAGLAVSVVLHFKRKYFQSLITVLISTFLFTISVLYFIVPKIEQYTQNAPVEFYKGLRDKDCYVETLGFKSYAHLFYSEVKCNENVKIPSQDSLLYGKINKNAYFVTKITKKSDYLNKFNIKELYEKNGFVFLIRYSNIK